MSELHRIGAGGKMPQADVIFVHGLDGDPFKTWQHDPDRQTDCWLHWLAQDAATVAVQPSNTPPARPTGSVRRCRWSTAPRRF